MPIGTSPSSTAGCGRVDSFHPMINRHPHAREIPTTAYPSMPVMESLRPAFQPARKNLKAANHPCVRRKAAAVRCPPPFGHTPPKADVVAFSAAVCQNIHFAFQITESSARFQAMPLPVTRPTPMPVFKAKSMEYGHIGTAIRVFWPASDHIKPSNSSAQ